MAQSREEELKEKFNMFDKDLNGSLTYKELERLMQYCGFNPTKKELKTLMKELDKDGDKEINFDEFYYEMSKLPDPVGELRESFVFHDKNKDGFIDKAELKGILSVGGNYTTDAEVDDLFKLVDENGDGKIQYEEFVELFSS